MSRPLAFASASFLLGCVAACVLLKLIGVSVGATVLAVLSLCLLVSGIISLIKLKKSNKLTGVVLSFCGLALLLCFLRVSFQIKPAFNLANGTSYKLSGTVEDLDYRDTSIRATLKPTNSPKFIVTLPILTEVQIGDSFSGEFILEKYDFEVYSQIGNGIYLKSTENTVSFERDNSEKKLLQVRETLSKRLYCCFDSLSAKLSEAMTIGNDDYFPASISDDFTSAGASHVLVVSGMHLAIVASFVMFLFGIFPVSKKISYLIELIFIFGFAVLTGFSFSIVRAGVMLIVCLSSKLTGSRYDPITSVMFSAMLILLFNPFAVLSASFVYSFAAVFGIEVFYPQIMNLVSEKTKKLPYYLTQILTAVLSVVFLSLSANIMLLPFEMMISTAEPLRSIISGTLLAVPSTLVVTIALVFAILPHSLHFLVLPLRIIAAIASRACVFVVQKVSLLPSLTVSLFSNFACVAIVILIVVGYILFRKNKALIAFSCAVMFVFISVIEVGFTKNSSFVVVCSGSGGYSSAIVENGEAEIIVTDNSLLSETTDALQKLHVNKITRVILRDGLSANIWGQKAKVLYCENASRSYDVGGLRFSFMLDETGESPDCDVLVTKSLTHGADSTSTFTIVAEGDIMKSSLSGSFSGRYMLSSENSTSIFEVKNSKLYII